MRPSGANAPGGRVIKQASGLAELSEIRTQFLGERSGARQRNIVERAVSKAAQHDAMALRKIPRVQNLNQDTRRFAACAGRAASRHGSLL